MTLIVLNENSFQKLEEANTVISNHMHYRLAMGVRFANQSSVTTLPDVGQQQLIQNVHRHMYI